MGTYKASVCSYERTISSFPPPTSDCNMDRSTSQDSALSDDTLHDPGSPSPMNADKSAKGFKPWLSDGSGTQQRRVEDSEHRGYGSLNGQRKQWMPKQHDNRTLVLCFDGTGDHFDSDVSLTECSLRSHDPDRSPQNSNVVQLAAMLRKDDNKQQLVYYQVCIPA